MPRRLPVRPAKLIGNLFVLAALTLIFTVYYVYVGIIMGPKVMGKFWNRQVTFVPRARLCC